MRSRASKRVNAAVLHATDYDAVKGRLAALEADLGEAFWNAVRANIQLLPEAKDWAHVVKGPIEPVIASISGVSAGEELPTTFSVNSIM